MRFMGHYQIETNKQTNMNYETQQEKREKDKAYLKIIMTENFAKLGREMAIKYHEALRTTKSVNPEKTTPKCTTIKLSEFKDNERTMKAAKWVCI